MGCKLARVLTLSLNSLSTDKDWKCGVQTLVAFLSISVCALSLSVAVERVATRGSITIIVRHMARCGAILSFLICSE